MYGQGVLKAVLECVVFEPAQQDCASTGIPSAACPQDTGDSWPLAETMEDYEENTRRGLS